MSTDNDRLVEIDGEPLELLPNLISAAPDASARAYSRAAALGWASRLTTDRHDPLAVLRNAQPVLEFLQAATSDADLQLRRMAGSLQSANDDEREPDDDGAGFALRVAVLYGAMTGAA
ncbi:hypothetical protein [Nonomuraea gerenzanensis]|uniref:Uncharacterized protein n=1 Tax=Nonomuraea gerenzanensis TaxID=93944 RepID=A0A1M4BKZ8_9ACTN|nr:hypothetical protein [Nonomuraea gerenzanensis]UBU19196.1 hypothetical protein LCN96_56350 [Nonomuraea gerenzanensis]SAP16355.1 hypothetical protein BN4615_P11018 [Nonomuraea gerenzanensis]